ncbi:FHA domain-containing protein, partial [Microbacterium sp.]|uniref:FHA domain-containing protein n=1 Tax=Microbacterium sp. TaxID=51671 RepID=UPI00322218E2
VAPPSTLPLIVPPPSGSPAEPAPPADAPMWQAPVREVPAAVVRPHRELWAPPPDPDAPDLFPEQSVEISAVVGSPAAGAPITAVEAMLDGDDLDQTVVVSRRRAWQLLPASGPPIALVADVVILGRQPDAQQAFPGAQLVALDDRTRTVSKTHARLERHGDGWRVVDLHSTNGVVVTAADGADAEIAPDAAVPVRERFVLGDVELRLVRLAR